MVQKILQSSIEYDISNKYELRVKVWMWACSSLQTQSYAVYNLKKERDKTGKTF